MRLLFVLGCIIASVTYFRFFREEQVVYIPKYEAGQCFVMAWLELRIITEVKKSSYLFESLTDNGEQSSEMPHVIFDEEISKSGIGPVDCTSI